MTNLKIWHGTVPNPNSTEQTRGFTASIYFNGFYGNIIPILKISQKGTHTFYRRNMELANYYPVKPLALMNSNNADPQPLSLRTFTPFINVNPRYDDTTGQRGIWVSEFTNRSVAATLWEVILYKKSASGPNVTDVPISKLSDIYFFFDTIGYGN
ncbi:MAG: hypothetical protein R2941_15775 [Desulfobacterales bacterium]